MTYNTILQKNKQTKNQKKTKKKTWPNTDLCWKVSITSLVQERWTWVDRVTQNMDIFYMPKILNLV